MADRWEILGYLTAFVNPLLGLLMGFLLWTDKKVKDHQATGKYVIVLSLVMGMAWFFYLSRIGAF